MKQYGVKFGTEGFLISNIDGRFAADPWTVRRDLTFYETVDDPIRASNSGRTKFPLGTPPSNLVTTGHALFVDPQNDKYLLAVPYDELEVN